MQELNSRTFLGTQGQRIRWMPSGTAEHPDPYGPSVLHRFIALGSWTPDLRAFQLGLYQLDIHYESGVLQSNSLVCLTDQYPIYHMGAFTDLQVAELGSGRLLVLTASAEGHLCRLVLQQLQPDTPVEDMLASPLTSDTLDPWVQPHRGPVSSVDVSPQKQEVLSAGQDGRLQVTDLETSTSRFDWRGSGCSSFTNARWLDRSRFVTSSGTAAGLQIWDIRSQESVEKSPSSWGHTGCSELDSTWGADRQVTWLHVHPSRPSVCATGSSQGCVTVWDLRFQSQPLSYIPPTAALFGDVWEVRFDTSEAFAAAGTSNTPVMFCTEDGRLGRFLPGSSQNGLAAFGANPASSAGSYESIIPQEAGAINSFDVEPSVGQDIVAVTSQEGLVYLCRPVPSANRAAPTQVTGLGRQQQQVGGLFGNDLGRGLFGSAVEAL